MIQIHINPTRVEKVLFVCQTEMEEDFDHEAWKAIRSLVDKIDQKLKEMVGDLSPSRGPRG